MDDLPTFDLPSLPDLGDLGLPTLPDLPTDDVTTDIPIPAPPSEQLPSGPSTMAPPPPPLTDDEIKAILLQNPDMLNRMVQIQHIPPPPPPLSEADAKHITSYIPPPPPEPHPENEPEEKVLHRGKKSVLAPSHMSMRERQKKTRESVMTKMQSKKAKSRWGNAKKKLGKSKTMAGRMRDVVKSAAAENKKKKQKARKAALPSKFTKSFAELNRKRVPIVTQKTRLINDMLGADKNDYGYVFEENNFFTDADLMEDLSWMMYELDHDVPLDILQNLFQQCTNVKEPYQKSKWNFSTRENFGAKLMGARGLKA